MKFLFTQDSWANLASKEAIKSLAIGKFDGIHLGHQALFKSLESGAILAIKTPKTEFLTPGREKEKYVQIPIFYADFEALKDMSGAEFVEILRGEFPNARKIVVGYDFVFGKNRACGIADLRSLFPGEVVVCAPVCCCVRSAAVIASRCDSNGVAIHNMKPSHAVIASEREARSEPRSINNMTEGDTLSASKESTSGLSSGSPCCAGSRNDERGSRHCETPTQLGSWQSIASNQGDARICRKNPQVDCHASPTALATLAMTDSTSPAQNAHSKPIHAAWIIELLRSGDVANAAKLLGRNYSITGVTIKGQGIGAKKLVPTINMESTGFVMPKNGVYATLCEVETNALSTTDSKTYKAISFIGHRATTDNKFAIETHIVESEPIKNIQTGTNITIYFLDFIRENKKFADLDSLKKEIKNDIKTAQKLHKLSQL